MPRYRILNLITKETAEIDADFASDAVKRLGWPEGSCRIELRPAEETSKMQIKRKGISDADPADQRRLLVLMVLLGALLGGLSGLGSGIAIVGAVFGAFIGAGLSVIMWGMLGSNAIYVVNTILTIALAAAAIGWAIQIIYKLMHL